MDFRVAGDPLCANKLNNFSYLEIQEKTANGEVVPTWRRGGEVSRRVKRRGSVGRRF